MIPPDITAREVLAWIDVVIGHPIIYTANRLGCGQSTIGLARATVARKLGFSGVDVASLVRAAYAVMRDH